MQVNLEVFDQQSQALSFLSSNNDEVSEVLYGGGARGGKTFLGCLWQTLRRLAMPGSVGLVCRELGSSLRDTTIRTFFEVLSILHVTSKVRYHSTDKIAYFDNGSVIFFRFLRYDPKDPEYDRLGSLGITDLFVDESQEVSAKALSVLKGRFSILNGTCADGTPWHTIPKALYTCNPRRNWIYNDFVKPAREGTLPPYRRFIKSLPTDNPHLAPAYIENLLRSDKITIQRLYYGNFEYDDDPGALCDYDAICDLFHNEHIQEVGGHSGSADIAMKGHDRFIATSWIGNVCRIAVDKKFSPGKEVYEDLKSLLIRDSIPRSLFVVDADGVGSYLESFLSGIKEFHGGGRPFDARYENLKSECAFILADLINRRAMRIVCDDLETIERIKTELGVLKMAFIDNDLKKKAIITKEKMKELLGHSPDYLDALIMAMFFRRVRNSGGATIKVTQYSTE